MQRFQERNIQQKLTRLLMVSSGVAVIVSTVAFSLLIVNNVRQSTVQDLLILAKVTAKNTQAAVSFGVRGDARELLEALDQKPTIRRAIITDSHGDIFASWQRNAQSPIAGFTAPLKKGHFWSTEKLMVVQPIELHDSIIGMVIIEDDLSDLRKAVRRAVVLFLIIAAFAMLAAYIAATYLQRIVSSPILELAGLARRVSNESNYDLRASSPGGAEMNTLVEAFNDMLKQIRTSSSALLESRRHAEERAQEAEQAKERLEAEICTREIAEEEVRRLNRDLELRVEERTEQLQSANRELEAFCYSVSHDLRAPLRSLRGFTAALQQDYTGQIDETGLDYLKRVQQAAERMGGLIDDLLRLSRVTTTSLRLRQVNLSDKARQITERLQETEYPKRDIRFIINEGLHALCDEKLVAIALENMLGNACKFTGRQACAIIEFGQEKTSRGSAFFVRDNGVGFDSAYGEKIFTAFQRLHTENEFEGSGIGMTIVQRIIHKHGGEVWAESKPGSGATFFFTLGNNHVSV